jgi:hypothetical protein
MLAILQSDQLTILIIHVLFSLSVNCLALASPILKITIEILRSPRYFLICTVFPALQYIGMHAFN